MSRQQRITAVFAAVFGDTLPTKLVPRLARLSELAGAFVDACEFGEPKPAAPIGVRADLPNAESAGLSTPPVKRKAGRPLKSEVIDWDTEPRLGKISDEKLSRLMNVNHKSVRKARLDRGIRGCGNYKVDWDNEARLGKMSDAELARIHNMSRAAVHNARKERGIPRYEPPQPADGEVSA